MLKMALLSSHIMREIAKINIEIPKIDLEIKKQERNMLSDFIEIADIP